MSINRRALERLKRREACLRGLHHLCTTRDSTGVRIIVGFSAKALCTPESPRGDAATFDTKAISMSETALPEISLRAISGRKVVVGMFVFGICATGLLFLYWKLHLMPFMPLQEAIETEFPGSAPRVEGGQEKMQKDTPTILRIVMKSQTDPTAVDIESLRAISAVRTRVAELAKEKVQLPDLDFIELHIYKLLQEQEIRKKSFRLDVKAGSEWREVDPEPR